MSFVDTFFNNYGKDTTGGSSGSYVNKVYLGAAGSKKVALKRGRQTINVPADKTLTTTEAKRQYLTDETLRNSWSTALRKNGITADPIQARAIWDLSVDGASDWYATSNGQQKVTPYQYLNWYASGSKKGTKKPSIPTRQIYEVTDEEIDADVNDIALKKLGRELQDADRSAEWYKDLVKGINKLYQSGVVTSVSEVKNPQTGKMEKVVRQTPGFSKEEISQKITTAVELADPESLERNRRIQNTRWLLSQGGRG
jgi:hypothetical protein